MSRKMTALVTVALICSIIIAIASIGNEPPQRYWEQNLAYGLGSVLALLGVSGLLSVLIGFVAAAVQRGAFRNAAYWSFVLSTPGILFLMLSGMAYQ